MLGKTHLRLGHKEKAGFWLKKTIEYRAYKPEDKEVLLDSQSSQRNKRNILYRHRRKRINCCANSSRKARKKNTRRK